jgi:sarcosine oxidase subunit beta
MMQTPRGLVVCEADIRSVRTPDGHQQGKPGTTRRRVADTSRNARDDNGLRSLDHALAGARVSTARHDGASRVRRRSFDLRGARRHHRAATARPSPVPTVPPMRGSSADIVIIGGGIIGAAIAWHLAARGAGRIRVLERATAPAAGSTGRATGGFRAQYGTTINVQLSLLSLRQLERFHEEHGTDPEYQPVGYLFMARTSGTLAVLQEALRVQHAAGYTDGHVVGPDDIARLSPAVDASRYVGATYARRDGYITPRALLDGLLDSARRRGVQVAFDAPVTAMHVDGDQVVAVETPTERLATGCVINAAGPWAAQVAALAGVTLPVVPVRRQVALTLPTTVLPVHTPMTIDADDGFHLRVRGHRVLLLHPETPAAVDPFDTTFDPAWLATIRARTRETFPSLADVPLDMPSCWAGLYEVSPDRHLLFGALPERPNLLGANGASGHGVMHALAIGQLMAELVCDGHAHSLDMTPLAPDRFRRGAAIEGPDLL